MAKLSAQELAEKLEKGTTIPAILLLGDEAYLRDACRKAIAGRYVPEASRTWAVSRYSADRGETLQALEQAQTLPMLAKLQVVFLGDAQAIEKLGEDHRDEAVAALERYLADPAPFTVLVIEATALDQRMKLAKVLAEKAQVVATSLGEKPEERLNSAVAQAKLIAAEEGVEFEKGAAEDLAEYVAADLLRMETEIRKLATYAGDRKAIRRQDVSSLVISEKATTVWELADMLASRQQKRALEFLDRLLRDGEEPLPMLGALTWMYRKLIEASEVKGVANGWQAARALGMRPEQAELALQSARRISKAKLLRGLRALQSADDRLKRGGADARTVLEFLIADLTMEEKAAAAR